VREARRRLASWMAVAGGLLATAATTGVPAAAADTVPTHVAVFDSVAATVARDLVPADAIPRGRALELAAPVPGDTLSLLERRLLSALERDGIQVRLSATTSAASIDPVTGEPAIAMAAPEGAASPLRLEARVEAKRVLYVRRVGKFPFGTKGYERRVAIQAQSRLLDAATGEVLWTRSGAAQRDDFVPSRDVEAAASSGNGLFRPAPPPRSGLRFLEPTIVGGVVAGLIVLFYSNRT